MKRFLIAAMLLVFVGLMFSEVNAGSIFGGNYIKRSGDTINGTLKVKTNTYALSVIQYQPSSGYIFLGDSTAGIRVVTSTSTNLFHRVSGVDYKLWTENNDGNGSGLDADTWKGKGYLDASLYWDIPSINANSATSTSVALAGADIADFCMVSTDNYDFINVVFSCHISTTGTVTIVAENNHTAALDPIEANYYVRVFKK